MISGTEQMTVTLKIRGISGYQTDKALTHISVARRKFYRGISINNSIKMYSAYIACPI